MNPTDLNPLTFPLQGIRLIEASAGTGKTWTIASLYVRLVLGHGNTTHGFGRPLLPPEILVVTFTQAATAELRSRIRDRLNQAARCFRGQPDEADPFLKALVDNYDPSLHDRCAFRLETAARWMDEAAISTIHSWCQRMLRQHAFDSGCLFDMELEVADHALLKEAVRDYWRSFFYPLSASAVDKITALLNSHPDNQITTVATLMKQGESNWYSGSEPLREAEEPAVALQRWAEWQKENASLEEQARACWHKHRKEIEALLTNASEQGFLNGRDHGEDVLSRQLAAIAEWAESGDCDESKQKDLNKGLCKLAENNIRVNAGHEKNRPRHEALRCLQTWCDHKEPEVSKPSLLLHLVTWVKQRYTQVKLQRAHFGFDDLLTMLDAALQRPGNERLAGILRKQYPVALIDEFQDTDPVQYRIFNRVYGSSQPNGTEAALLLIGDPKQAIYSFRGADIHTYLKARATTEGRHYTLGTNFRSTEALIAAVNHCFSRDTHAAGAFLFKRPDGDNALPFHLVKAAGRKERFVVDGEPDPNPAALTLWHLDTSGELTSANQYHQLAATATAQEIVRLLNLAAEHKAGFQHPTDGYTPLKSRDIAILVPGFVEARKIREALAQRGLRSVYLSDRDSVYQCDEAKDLLAWLTAAADPENERTLKAALATPTLDLGYAELDALNREEQQWEGRVEQFQRYRSIWRNQGILPMIRHLLKDFDLPSRLLSAPGGERKLTNLLHLAELLQAADTIREGENALIRYLASAIEATENSGDAEAHHLVRLESDADLIKIVTVHKSKGLEYPLVFLPFACKFKEITAKATYYRYHNEAGTSIIDLKIKVEESKTESKNTKTKSENESRQKADQERLQEDLRLLYVAMTRARHKLWVGLVPFKVGKTNSCHLHKTAIGHLLGFAETDGAESLGERLTAFVDGCPHIQVATPAYQEEMPNLQPISDTPLRMARVFPARLDPRWWIASYSALQIEAEKIHAEKDELPTLLAETPQWGIVSEETHESVSVIIKPKTGTPLQGLHDFPRGPGPGTFLHSLLEWCAKQGFKYSVSNETRLRETVSLRCQQRDLESWATPLADWLLHFLNTPLPLPGGSTFTLADLPPEHYQTELEFWYAVASEVKTTELDRLITSTVLAGTERPRLAYSQLHGMLKGFIDLVIQHDGRFYVIDYKSNWLGQDDQCYDLAAMQNAILNKRYDLQYTLYLLAVHRLLKSRMGNDYSCADHLGGAAYLFLRGSQSTGAGVFCDAAKPELLSQLDELFVRRC